MRGESKNIFQAVSPGHRRKSRIRREKIACTHAAAGRLEGKATLKRTAGRKEVSGRTKNMRERKLWQNQKKTCRKEEPGRAKRNEGKKGLAEKNAGKNRAAIKMVADLLASSINKRHAETTGVGQAHEK